MDKSTAQKKHPFIKPMPPYGELVWVLGEVYNRVSLPSDLFDKIETILIETDAVTDGKKKVNTIR